MSGVVLAYFAMEIARITHQCTCTCTASVPVQLYLQLQLSVQLLLYYILYNVITKKTPKIVYQQCVQLVEEVQV